MRPIPLIVAVGLALAPLVPAPLQAQGGIGPGVVINDIDADGDRRISRDEYVAARDRDFARYDRNGDGSLGLADFPRSADYRRALGRIEDRIADADRNGDMLLSREEMHTAPTVIFDRADTSRDGYLSQNEIAAARAAFSRLN
jgi:hypothetical protein